jgi:transcription elongation GreA/GreB family factor
MTLDRNLLTKAAMGKLTDRLAKQKNARERALKTSIKAEGAMQSHHDTTKEEMARLAEAHSRSIRQTREAIRYFRRLETQKIDSETVGAGNLIKIQEEGKTRLYFLAEHGGGLEIKSPEGKILILSPDSLLGKSLLGKSAGAIVNLQTPGGMKTIRILKVE